jgi:hypothetical protein
MFWPFNCFKKKDVETLLIKKSQAYLCANEKCKHGALYSYKEADLQSFTCKECKKPMKLV